MGQDQSQEQKSHNVSTGKPLRSPQLAWARRSNVPLEQLSHELAVRFAKCITPLEITHFKDVFRSLADVQDGMQYWKEETLCRFLVLPDVLGPGPLVYQMATCVQPLIVME